jgi:hypothetical protein
LLLGLLPPQAEEQYFIWQEMSGTLLRKSSLTKEIHAKSNIFGTRVSRHNDWKWSRSKRSSYTD